VKRLFLLAALLVFPAGSAAADGCPPSQCGIFSSAVPGSRFLHVRTNGEHGPLRVYDIASGRNVVTLRPGMASADGTRFVSVHTVERATSYLSTHSLPDGTRLSWRKLPGRFGLAGVSRTGRRVVLSGVGPRGTTAFAIADGGRVARTVRLSGAYELETLSPDGNRLFLIHWRRNGYDLETYDLTTGRLRPTVMLEEGKPEKLVGQAWRGVATRDGRWLLTLYLKGREAFVHALDLQRGIGHCVDLPAHGDPLTLGASGLGLSPDERRLYVVSPVIGRVFTIDLRRARVTRVARFEPWLGPDEVGFGASPNVAVSANGRMLYFNGNGLLWAYDIPYGRVRGPYPARRWVMGLAFTPDDRRLVVLGGDGKLGTLDAATGRRVG
jgi:WD40 repeat protein